MLRPRRKTVRQNQTTPFGTIAVQAAHSHKLGTVKPGILQAMLQLTAKQLEYAGTNATTRTIGTIRSARARVTMILVRKLRIPHIYAKRLHGMTILANAMTDISGTAQNAKNRATSALDKTSVTATQKKLPVRHHQVPIFTVRMCSIQTNARRRASRLHRMWLSTTIQV